VRQLNALMLALALAACIRAPVPAPEARYMIGEPYALGGLWSYPHEDFALTETGIGVVLQDASPDRRTANGEIYDPDALVAAHRTLQLPAILVVTNLETGRELRVRVNDRGPEQPGRILGLSRRAAALLGIPRGGAAQLRIAVDPGPSRALATALPSRERRALAISTAPRALVSAEPLAPPQGARGTAWTSAAAPRPVATPASDLALPPDPLPEEVVQRPATPGWLVVEVGSFFRRDLAQRQAARLAGLGARVETSGAGRQAIHRVRIGPFADLATADQRVADVLAAGLPEVRLLVE